MCLYGGSADAETNTVKNGLIQTKLDFIVLISVTFNCLQKKMSQVHKLSM